MKSQTAILLQQQVDKPGVGNPHGYPGWYLHGGNELKAREGKKDKYHEYHHIVSPRYPTPTWQQLVRSVQKRYRVKW